MQLHVEHVFVALPSLKEHEPVRRPGILVQERLMEPGLATHRVENAVEQRKEALALIRRDR